MWKLSARNIGHKFNQRIIFRDISFDLTSGSSAVITGPNGSGKTTLVRIICYLLRPAKGDISFSKNGESIDPQKMHTSMGLVGPYLQLYNDLSALENYIFFTKIRGLPVDLSNFRNLMERFGLDRRENDPLRTYSSGMLQRVKYVMALFHKPEILILDEPTANLDETGSQTVFDIMNEQKEERILIVATNEPEELKYGDQQIRVTP